MSSETKLELRRLVVFGIMGSLNTGVCYVAYAALVHALAWDYRLALVADYCFGAVLGFLLHRVATFADRKHVRLAFGKYVATLVLAFLLNFAVLDWTVRRMLLDPLAGQAVALIFVMAMSYLMQKHWVFRSHHEPQGEFAAEPEPIPISVSAPIPATVLEPVPVLMPAASQRRLAA
jgi:putative flippase GtrA